MGKISIIVPIYKVEKYLDRCIESIVNQTYKNIEIILVDDGSPDNCPQMCDEWAKKDERIKVVHKQNGGVSTARNAGLDIATGEYIQFVDSDDFLELNACEILISNMKNTNADLVVANFKNIGGEARIKQINDFVTRDQSDAMVKLISCGSFGYLHAKLFRKELIKSYFICELKYHEDFIFVSEYIKNCTTISYLNTTIYNYVLNQNSAMFTFSKIHFYNACIVVQYCNRKLKKRYTNTIIFIDTLINKLLLSVLLEIINTTQLSKKEKKQYISQCITTQEFKTLNKKIMTIKQKIIYTLLKMNAVKMLQFLYKINKNININSK